MLFLSSPNISRLNKKSLFLFCCLKFPFFLESIKSINFSSIGANLIRLVLIYVLTFLPPLKFATSTAHANNLPITPDGSTNTQIDSAANGVSVVNIAAPNSGGLSHNKFTDYNVNPSGLVINNATGNPNQIIKTNLAGLIVDNPNLLTSGSARVILNEVTSANRSILNGYTEIGGKQADLIIANPNGIEMNSAGFINIARLTAMVGSANQFNGDPSDLSFNLNGNKNSGNNFLPKLTISGLGLDVTRVAETDLVASIMEIVAPIYGIKQELNENNEVIITNEATINLRSGDKEFNYNTKLVTSDNTNPGSNRSDEVAIDASNIAKIQAGQIYMIATKEGFGVKYTGDMLASRAGVEVDAKGNIVYNNVLAEAGNIKVKTTNGDIAATGITHAKDANSDVILDAAGNVTNEGQLLSARDISVTAGNSFENKKLKDDQDNDLINLSNNDFIINAVQLINSGIISANNDLTLTNNEVLSNEGQIIANRNLSLTSNQITNGDLIIAGNKVNITVTDFLTNDGDILSLVENLLNENSLPDTALTINALDLNNNKQIAANSAIIINSNDLNNNTANSQIISGKNIDLNITNLNNDSGTIDSRDVLKIRNLTTNNSQAALLFAISDTNTSISNEAGYLKATNAIDINIGSSDYDIEGILETDGSINIRANNITNQGDLRAIDYIKIVANDSFVNGINGGDNSNIKIASNNYLEIEANNNINNYAILSAKTILSLKSLNGNINNYDGAELLASNQDNPSNSQLTLEAINGAINQYSKNSVVVNGDHTITANDYTNTGRIDIAGTLTMNITNNLINEIGALIYAGNNMYLNIGYDLTNKTNATIYAENDLIIRKREFTNQEQSNLNNLKDDITNLELITDKTEDQIDLLKQKRQQLIDLYSLIKINKLDNISANIQTYNGNIIIYTKELNNKRSSFATQNAAKEIYNYKIDGKYWHSLNQYSYSGVNDIESIIDSGNDMILSITNNLNNEGSAIYAKRNLDISIDSSTNNINNNSYYVYSGTREYYLGKKGHYGDSSWRKWGQGKWGHHSEKIIYTDQQYATALIKAGSSIAINGNYNSSIVNDDPNFNNYDQEIIDRSTDQKSIKIVNGIDINNLLNTGKVDKDLSDYLNGPDNQGMFTKNPNPNGPLFETRSEFVDQSKFFGSDYFYQKIGLDLTDVQTQLEQNNSRLVGDQFFQTKIIEEQLRTVKKNSLLISEGSDITSTSQEIKSLFDNASEEFFRLGFAVDEPLTQTQIDSLEKDIVWFETETINGELYVVPKIYLTKATRENLEKNDSLSDKAVMFAGADMILNGADGAIKNAGSINAGNNININTSGNIINDNFSEIIAGNNLDLVSNSGSIVNKSKLKADGAMIISAANNVYNIASVKTNDANLLNEFSGISPYSVNNATVRESGNISSKLIENASISSTSLIVSAGNDFNNYGSDIITTGNTTINAGNNVNISTVKLRNRRDYKDKGITSITDETKNIGSNITSGGNLALSSNNDTLIKGSNVNVDGNAAINTGGDLNIVSATDSYYNFEARRKKGSFGRRSSSSSTKSSNTNVESNINVAGDINSISEKNIGIVASDLTSNTSNINLITKDQINILSASDILETKTTSKKHGLTTTAINNKTNKTITQVTSDLNAGNGNISLTSGGDTTIIASNISSGNDTNIKVGSYIDAATNTETINNKATLNVLNAMDSEYNYEYSSKIGMDGVAIAVGALTGGGLGMYMGAQAQKGNIKVKESYDKTLVESNIKAGNNLSIRSASDVNIVSSDLSSGTGDTTIIAGSLIDNNDNLVITDKDADINIASAVETHYSFEQNQKLRADYGGIATGSALALASVAVAGPAGLLVAGGVAANADKFAQKNSTTENFRRRDFQNSSNVNSGNDILSNSQNDTNVVASNLNANRDTILTANNINIVSATELDLSSQSSSKTRLLASEKETIDVTKTINKASNINSGNSLLLQSGGDTNIISSNVAVGTKDSDGNLIKGGDATIIAGKYTDETGTEIYDKDAKINIAAAQDVETSIHKVEKMSVKINDVDKIAKGFATIYGTTGAIMSSYKIEYQDRKDTSTTTTNQASNIDVANNLVTNSASNTNLLASNINVGNDALMVAGTMNVNGVNQINDKANINIISAKDTVTTKKKNDQLILANDIEVGGDITAGTFEHKTEKSYTETNAASAITVGNNLDMDSTNDISIIGSNVMAGGDATLTAGRKVNILASQNNSNASTSNLSGEMGVELTLDANEISAGAAVRMDYQDDESENSRQASSNVLASNIFVNSKDDINLGVSNLYAQNDINLTSTDGNVNILSANEMTKEDKLHLGMEAGVKIGITHNIGNTIDSLKGLADIDLANLTGVGQAQATIDMVSALLSGDNVDEMLEGNEQAINDTSKLLNAGGTGGSAGIILHVEAEADKTTSKNNQALGSLIKSGNDINIASNNKDIKIEGSALLANNDVNLTAGNNIDIIASNNNSSFKNVGGSLSLDIALYGAGYSVGGELHGAKNSNNSYNNSVINADNNVNIATGNNTSIKGANIEAKNDLAMNIGGNLDVQSLQNTSKERSFAVGVGYGTMNGGQSYSANVGYSKGDRKWVDDQTTLIGGNSVDIAVANNTNLVGAVIANKKEDGTDGGNLTLATNTLTYSNIQDKDKARSFSVSGSYSAQGSANDNNRQSQRSQSSTSGSIGYSMHDRQQDTNATIGGGNIVVGGINTNTNETLVAGLNRDINKSQVITKDLSVDPIEVSATVRWDSKDGFENPFKAKAKELTETFGDPRNIPQVIKNTATRVTNLFKSEEDKTEIPQDGGYKHATGSILSPFKRNLDGVAYDVAVIMGDIQGVDPNEVGPIVINTTSEDKKNEYFNVSLESSNDIDIVNEALRDGKEIGVVKDNGQFIGVDKKTGLREDGTKRDYTELGDWENVYALNKSQETTIEQVRNNPDLISNSIHSNGIMNNKDEATRNAIMQSGGFGQDNSITVMYDNTGKGQEKNEGFKGVGKTLKGITQDLLEVGVNQFGGGLVITSGTAQDRELIDIAVQNAKANGEQILLTGHSAGGRRNYQNLFGANRGQYLDDNGNSVLNVQFYGAPVNSNNATWAANYSGANLIGVNNNNGDFVGNVLGDNGGNGQLILSTIPGSILLFTKKSPHSNYNCNHALCNNYQPAVTSLNNSQ